ncbi:MAG: hypothetical protein JWQ06_2165 [Mucilaginibacter sp.]|nr:hypothetical protein [Mucilaginibacter sp.]
MRKLIVIIICFVVIGFIGTCMYFVVGVSSTIPPIKKYEFSGSVNQLLYGINKYTSTNANVTLKITDTTGNKHDGYAIYMDIEIKSEASVIIYNLKCEKDNDDGEADKTLVQLIGAFNERNYKVGGYGINGTGVKKMVNDFELAFLMGLKQQQHMSIIPL